MSGEGEGQGRKFKEKQCEDRTGAVVLTCKCLIDITAICLEHSATSSATTLKRKQELLSGDNTQDHPRKRLNNRYESGDGVQQRCRVLLVFMDEFQYLLLLLSKEKMTVDNSVHTFKDDSLDDSLYSRQRYVLGDFAMNQLQKAHIFLSGLGGLGVEIGMDPLSVL